MIQLARFGNFVAVIGVSLVLLAAFGMQVVLEEPPCPLCNLQRLAFVLCGFGFLLNLRFGVRPAHYGLSLLAALFGVAVAGRQVLLHIAPGTGTYGSPLLGLHLYTWSLLAFVGVVAGVALLLILDGRPDHERGAHPSAPRLRGISRLAAYLLVAVTLANAVSSFAQCGPIDCEGDAQGYWISKFLP